MDTISGVSSSAEVSTFENANSQEEKKSMKPLSHGGTGLTGHREENSEGTKQLPKVVRYLKRMEIK